MKIYAVKVRQDEVIKFFLCFVCGSRVKLFHVAKMENFKFSIFSKLVASENSILVPRGVNLCIFLVPSGAKIPISEDSLIARLTKLLTNF